MYYITDLYKNTRVSFERRTGVLYFWLMTVCEGSYDAPKFGLPEGIKFSDLNLSGHDMVRVTDLDGASYRLRRYQVTDERGRVIDIRDWEEEIVEVSKNPGKYDPSPKEANAFHRKFNGYKRSNPSRRYPAFTMSRLRDEAYRGTELEDIDEKYLPVIDHSQPRNQKKCVYPCWHYSKSWKEQTNASRQWGRHKQRGKKLPRKPVEHPKTQMSHTELTDLIQSTVCDISDVA